MAASVLRLLLPEWASFGRQSLQAEVARTLGRADALAPGEQGRRAQRARAFACASASAGVAAIARQRDASDAGDALWLRADPAHVRPDINGARMLAYGRALMTSQSDVDALLPALRPVFEDAGMLLDAPRPDRWYLRLPPDADPPDFSEPDEALGEDLFEHQPQGETGRPWRALLNELQIVLHNHPHNAARAARGMAPVNALWIWGAGRRPDRVRSAFAHVIGDDDALDALAHAAGAAASALPEKFAAIGPRASGASVLVDLAHLRDLAALQRDWLAPAFADVRMRRLSTLELDSRDGRRLCLRDAHRLRFWRRPWTTAQ